MEDYYAKIAADRAALEQDIEQANKDIEAAREKIRKCRATIAALPRPPIQRKKKAEVEVGSFEVQERNPFLVGKALITGKGTLTLTDANGNDVTAENTVVTDHE